MKQYMKERESVCTLVNFLLKKTNQCWAHSDMYQSFLKSRCFLLGVITTDCVALKRNVFFVHFVNMKVAWNTAYLNVLKSCTKRLVSFSLSKHHAMMTYWESKGISPLILNLGTRWRLVGTHSQ